MPGIVAGQDSAHKRAQTGGQLTSLAQQLQGDRADTVPLALRKDPELTGISGRLVTQAVRLRLLRPSPAAPGLVAGLDALDEFRRLMDEFAGLRPLLAGRENPIDLGP